MRGNAADQFAALRTAFELVSEPVFIVDQRSGWIEQANVAACRALLA